MAFRPRSAQLLLAAACVWQAFPPSQFAQGQVGPVAQQQQSPTANGPGAPSQEFVRPNNIAAYDDFFSYIGEEDDLIQKQTQEGKQPILARTDYSSAIGIDKGEEQTLLSIVLGAYHRRVQSKKEYETAWQEFEIARQRGYSEGLTSPKFGTWLASDSAILDETWFKLKQTSSKEDFQKIDAYVDHSFSRRRYPGENSAQQEEKTPFPVNVSYSFFIVHMASEDARVTREVQEGKPEIRQNYGRAAHFDEGKELPMRAIVLEANRRLRENDRQLREFFGQWSQQYGQKARTTPLPRAYQELAQQHDTIIEETKTQLKEELGEDGFNNLDAWIKKHYGAGKIIGGTPPPSNTAPQ